MNQLKLTKKQKEFKKLRWKYFLERKMVEMHKGLMGLVAIIFVPFYFGKLLSYIFNINISDLGEFWLLGSLSSILIILIVGLLFTMIRSWLQSNWKHATEDAEEIMKKRRKSK